MSYAKAAASGGPVNQADKLPQPAEVKLTATPQGSVEVVPEEEFEELKHETKKDAQDLAQDVKKGAEATKKQGKQALNQAKKQGQEALDTAAKKLEETYNEMKAKYEELKKQGGEAFDEFKKEFDQFEREYSAKAQEAANEIHKLLKRFDAQYLNGAGSALVARIELLLQRAWVELQNPVVVVQTVVGALELSALYIGYRDRHRINLDNPLVLGTHLAVITGTYFANKHWFDKYYPQYDQKRLTN